MFPSILLVAGYVTVFDGPTTVCGPKLTSVLLFKNWTCKLSPQVVIGVNEAPPLPSHKALFTLGSPTWKVTVAVSDNSLGEPLPLRSVTLTITL